MARAMTDVLGKTVKQGRIRLKLTETELSDRVGVHQSWISRKVGPGRERSAALINAIMSDQSEPPVPNWRSPASPNPGRM